MSLTRHLTDTSSPIRQFIHQSAPELALAGTRGSIGMLMGTRFGFDDLTALETQIPIPEAVKPAQRRIHAVTTGMALDYRIRMSLPGFEVSETTAQQGLDLLGRNTEVVHRGKHIHRMLEQALGFTYLTLKDKNPHPLSLARVSVVLAWCEAIYRAGPITALAGDLGRRIKRAKTPVDLMMGIEDDLVFDVAWMHQPLEPLVEEWNEAVANGAAYTPNPQFVGSAVVGGADADWVIGELLVELKTREDITNPWLRDALFQLIGYTLLDLDDSLIIRHVGILLPRQPYLATWDLDDLFGRDAEGALPELRESLAALLIDMIPGDAGEDDIDEVLD